MDRNIHVCYCMGVNSGKIIDKVNEGCEKFSQVQQETGLGCGCGRCVDHAREVFAQAMEEKYEK